MEASHSTESFHGLLLRHRGRTGLSQRDLADRMGAGRRTVQDWEAGLNHPSAERLQALIQVLLTAGGLAAGQEAAEARQLWAAVLDEAPRMRTPLDEVWLANVLAEGKPTGAVRDGGRTPAVTTSSTSMAVTSERSEARGDEAGAGEREHDWGSAPDVLGFVGRTDELVTLREWVLESQCRLAALLGMGGMGKTALAARLAQDVAPSFERLYWRSLRDAPPIGEWMAGAIGFLSGQRVVAPEGEVAQLRILLQLLQQRPSLLVLDNFETLLQPGDAGGGYREGYPGYGKLLQAIGEGRHRSCLLVTSRESPPDFAMLHGGAVRSFHLGGLGVADGQTLLAGKGLSGSPHEWSTLVDRLGGNGLALKVVGERIRELFGGELEAFLDESGSATLFGGIRRLIAEQIERSSALEQSVLRVLAVEREPVSISQLIADAGSQVGRGAVLEAIEALLRRSLVERAEATDTRGHAAFTLQSVVLEYLTDRLVEDVSEEIAREHPGILLRQPLIKAVGKDYVRASQERLIGWPIVQRLLADYGQEGVERHLVTLLDGWRARTPAEQGYGPGNVVNLLRLARGDLRHVDLSRLTVRQAYLAGIDAQDANLADACLTEAVLAEAFSLPISVALSRDGTLLVAGTSAGEVWLWRVADRAALLALQAHTGTVWGVALSADARLLASAGMDGVLRIWDLPGGQPLATVLVHSGPLYAVALSADGRLVATGSWDGTVRLFESPGGQLLKTLQGHTGVIWGVALSADGHLLASGSFDGTITVWEAPFSEGDAAERWARRSPAIERSAHETTADVQPLMALNGHTGGVRCVALTSDGRLLASGGYDETVRLWDVPRAQLLAAFPGHAGGVRGVTLSAHGELVASGSFDGTIRVWEAPVAEGDALARWAGSATVPGQHSAMPLNGGRLTATLQGHAGVIWGLALDAEGHLLASGGYDGNIRLWEARSGQQLATLQGHTSGIWSIAVSADGQLLASGGFDGAVRLWDSSSGQQLAIMHGHTGGVRGVALSGDGGLLASGGYDGAVRLWQSTTGRLLATMQGHTGGVRGVALSCDGEVLASGGEDGIVRLWEAPTGQPLATLQGHTGEVRGVALSGDGRLLASASFDASVRLWQVPSGGSLATLRGHNSGVWGVALSTDGHIMASGGFDGTVRVWDAASTQLLGTLQGHTGAVWGVALSADGRVLASAGFDGTVRLWDVSAGQLLATFEGHSSPVWGVALSADGHLAASAGYDGTVRLWDVTGASGLATLRNDRAYERVNVTGLTGVTEAQRAALAALGAVGQS
jgi:WD40 repeat protein/transcriptional regulator with XRE-family HTH domain